MRRGDFAAHIAHHVRICARSQEAPVEQVLNWHACAAGREPLAVTVAATTPDDARLWISPGVASNYGRCVDVWAPGSEIVSASRRSDAATEYRSGTSQAVPFVAGAAALYLQNSSGARPCMSPGIAQKPLALHNM